MVCHGRFHSSFLTPLSKANPVLLVSIHAFVRVLVNLLQRSSQKTEQEMTWRRLAPRAMNTRARARQVSSREQWGSRRAMVPSCRRALGASARGLTSWSALCT